MEQNKPSAPFAGLFVGEVSSENPDHLSSESRRALYAGLYVTPGTPPNFVDHLHIGLDLTLITHGSLHLLLDNNQQFTLEAGNIFIIPGGNRHRTRVPDGGHVCCYGMEIPPAYFAALPKTPELGLIADRLSRITDPLPVKIITDQSAYYSLRGLFEEMLTVYHDIDDPCVTEIMKTFNTLMALYVVRLLRNNSSDLPEHPTTQRILEVQAWLDRNISEPITLTEMASMANLSTTHFNALFRKVTGVSPKAYLLKRRLEHAEFLLKHTILPVTEISLTVGFNDISYFANFFKRSTGMSPRDYRNTILKDKP